MQTLFDFELHVTIRRVEDFHSVVVDLMRRVLLDVLDTRRLVVGAVFSDSNPEYPARLPYVLGVAGVTADAVDDARPLHDVLGPVLVGEEALDLHRCLPRHVEFDLWVEAFDVLLQIVGEAIALVADIWQLEESFGADVLLLWRRRRRFALQELV